MKQETQRRCAAFLLLGVGIVAAVGILSSILQPEEKTRILFVSPPDARVIRLYTVGGETIEVLRTNADGEVVSPLLSPGVYFAATNRGCTSFSLDENAGISVLSGCGEARGKQLRMGQLERGQVTVERLVTSELLQQDGWVEYVLQNEDTQLQEVLRSATPGEVLHCDFLEVPYGTYSLLENGVEQCRVTISAQRPVQRIALT